MKKEIHAYTEEHILHYMDNELGTWKKFWFIRHLKNCPFCNQLISEYKLIEQGLRTKPAVAVSIDFKNKLMNAIAREPEIKKEPIAKGFEFSWSYAIAAVFLLAILTLYFLGMGPQNLLNGAKFVMMNANPSFYIKMQHFVQQNLAFLSMFRSLIAYTAVGLLSAWGIFYIHKSSN